jgi:hypothetical protein
MSLKIDHNLIIILWSKIPGKFRVTKKIFNCVKHYINESNRFEQIFNFVIRI